MFHEDIMGKCKEYGPRSDVTLYKVGNISLKKFDFLEIQYHDFRFYIGEQRKVQTSQCICIVFDVHILKIW